MNYLTIAIAVIALYFASAALAEDDALVAQADNAPVATQMPPPVPPRAEDERLATPLLGYVSDQFYVPLRETPCSRCKIVHRGIKSGTKLDVLAKRDGWLLVMTPRGVEGWMEQQHVMDSPAARVRIDQSDAAMRSMTNSKRQLEQTIAELREQADSLQAELDSAAGNSKDLVRELATIKEISADAITLNDQNQALVKQNHLLQRENDVLNANLDDLQKDRRNESFLYGGLTVFLGAILVILIPKLRGRKRFSEWQ